MDTSGFVTADEVLSDILNNRNQYGKDEWWRLKRFLIRGVQKINDNFKLCTSINVVYLPLSENNTVQLPADFREYSKIGIEVNNHIWTLSLIKRLCTAKVTECNVPVSNLRSFNDVDYISSVMQVPFVRHMRGSSLVTAYGLSGGYNHAYYNIDVKKGLIFFEGDVTADNIVLEYRSSGISLTDNILIPAIALEALLAFIHWQRIDNDDNYPVNEKMRKEQQFKDEMRQLSKIAKPVRIHELMDAIYSGMKQTVKR